MTAGVRLVGKWTREMGWGLGWVGAYSTHTFTLEWVEEVAGHLPIVPRCTGGVVHARHVVGRVLSLLGNIQCNTVVNLRFLYLFPV